MARKTLGRVTPQATEHSATKRSQNSRLQFEALEDRRVLAAYINEIYFDPPHSGGDLRYEYIELRGTPNASLDDTYLIFLENENNSLNTGNPGVVEFIFNLNGESFGTNGFLTIRQQNTPFTVAPGTTDLVDAGTDNGWGGVGSTLNIQVEANDNKIENSGFTAMLIHNTGGPSHAPVIGQDLDIDNNGLDPAASDDNDWITNWTIEDSIGIFSEYGESEYGRLYAPINFGPEGPANVEPGAAYYAVGFEIEYVARYGNSTGQTAADWDVSNLTDDPLAGYDAVNHEGWFPQSGDPQGTPTFVETNQGIPYGTILTDTLGAPNYPGIPNSTVVDRRIFYNNSFYDGNNVAIQATIAGANNDDNDARDASLNAYLPGSGAATELNMSSYDKGINGIMIDLSTGVDHSGLTLANVANNFTFKVGNDNTPANWAVAPAPTGLSMTPGGGVSGSDRVTITWGPGAIVNKWLEVGVRPTAQTGLAALALTVDPDGPGAGTAVAMGDVFFFGNARGDGKTGNSATGVTVDASDELIARNNPKSAFSPALVDNDYDYNKDKLVDAADQLIARNNPVGAFTPVRKINIGTAGPLAPEGDGGDSGIASALASTAPASETSPRPIPQAILDRLEGAAAPSARSLNAYYGQLADLDGPELTDAGDVSMSAGEVDDELIIALATGL